MLPEYESCREEYFTIFEPLDREIVECAELYRAYLLATNPFATSPGRESHHEKHLREMTLGRLMKLMVADSCRSGGPLSKEAIIDRIVAAKRGTKEQTGPREQSSAWSDADVITLADESIVARIAS